MDQTIGSSADVVQSKAPECVHPILQQLWREELLNMGWTSDDHDDPELSMTRYTLLFYIAAFRDDVTDPSPSLIALSQPRDDLTGWLAEHCPPALHTFYDLWRRLVPAIRALSTKERDHLWRIICGSGCVSPSFSHDSHLYGIAATLQAVSEAFYKWCSRRDEPPKPSEILLASHASICTHLRLQSRMCACPQKTVRRTEVCRLTGAWSIQTKLWK
ncbi:hypothetical protein C8Q74DRAFT_529608 [Fomes fomentarius]|nr:hypothetical protein C8Q74DRAFT_529608 [Fomes fomentarius]